MTSISDTNVVNAPGGLVEVAYQQRTTEYAPSTNVLANVPNMFSSHCTFVADGSPYIVDFFCPRVINSGPWSEWYLYDGSGNNLGRLNLFYPGDNQGAMHASYRTTPTAGSIVSLNIRGRPDNPASGTIKAVSGDGTGGNEVPSFLRVSKIIQASQLIVQTPNAPLVTSLPSNAIDGQEVRYLADNTNGIIWNFRYRAGSSSTYKWEFIGGQSLHSYNTGGATTSSSYQTTGIPSVTVPLSGDYKITWGGYLIATTSVVAIDMYIGLFLANSEQYNIVVNATGQYGGSTSNSTNRLAGVNANSIIDLRYKSNGSTNVACNRLNLTVTPIRVSA